MRHTKALRTLRPGGDSGEARHELHPNWNYTSALLPARSGWASVTGPADKVEL
ncbi:MAG TPA: hypothetical protein VE713_06430 [Pyrinomonadaceae bacterium]|nr:hypothetical protein [Pyrinomonadaceae bacterium]